MIVVSKEQIKELITRRRRQILVHSIIYYRNNDNLITDVQYDLWSTELQELQHKYPKLANECVYAKDFDGFEGSGFNLPLGDPWALNTANRLINYIEKQKKV